MDSIMTLFSGHDFGVVGTLFISLLAALLICLCYMGRIIHKKIMENFKSHEDMLKSKLEAVEFNRYVDSHKVYHEELSHGINQRLDRIDQKQETMNANQSRSNEILHQLVGQLKK